MREVISASFLKKAYLFWIAIVMATLLHSPAALATQEKQTSCEGALGTKTFDLPHTLTITTTTDVVQYQTWFEFEPIDGVTKYSMEVIEFTANGVPQPDTIGEKWSIDTDNPPRSRLGLHITESGTIGVVVKQSSAHPSNSKGIAQMAAFHGSISGLARVTCEKGSSDLKITSLRITPSSPIPGLVSTLRGTVKNQGEGVIRNIDFSLDSTPDFLVLESKLRNSASSPRIASLAADESKEFTIPVLVIAEVGDDTKEFETMLTMSGGNQSDSETLQGGLDLEGYHTTISEKVLQFLLDFAISAVDKIDELGDSSTYGGIKVGQAEGVLNAFVKMGDGILSTTDFVGEISGNSTKREQIVAAVKDYFDRKTKKEIANDLKDLGIEVTTQGVNDLSDWAVELGDAVKSGDNRKVTAMLTEPATEVAIGFGAEQVAGKIMAKFFGKVIPKITPKSRKKKRKAPNKDSPLDEIEDHYAADVEDLKELPTNKPLRGKTVQAAGITPDEHAWMIEETRRIKEKYDVDMAFFVRPRPKEAAKHAFRGLNGKPVDIKLKSQGDIDVDWLGAPADNLGTVMIRKPKDPTNALEEAIELGFLKENGQKHTEIVELYNDRMAEYKNRDKYLKELNAENNGKGIEVLRYGKKDNTTLSLDSEGNLIMDYNKKGVFSDIDMLHIALRNGEHLPKHIHDEISKLGGWLFDRQHGDTFATSDVSQKLGNKFSAEYGKEHSRGGTPLIKITTDNTTATYVKSYELPPPDYDGPVYGSIRNISYE